jgi:hypothetical protein
VIVTAAVTLLTAVTLLNLFLLLGVIRRLRGMAVPGGDSPGLPRAGMPVGDFAEVSAGGQPVTRADLSDGESLVVFLSPTCKPCGNAVDQLIARPPSLPDRTYLFVLGEPTTAGVLRMVERLNGVGITVMAEPGRVDDAFGVTGVPAAILVRDGRVVHASHELADVLKVLRDVTVSPR